MNEPKTAADVVDHALTGIENGLGKLFDAGGQIAKAVTEKAPEVWRGMVGYHRALAYSELCVSVVLIVLSVIAVLTCVKFLKLGTAALKGDPGSSFGFASVMFSSIFGFISIATLLVQLCAIPEKAAKAAVPERAAAIELIEIVRGNRVEP